MKLAPARAKITKARCAVGKITRKRTAAGKVGRVVAQRPAAGVRKPRGTKIALTVGRR